MRNDFTDIPYSLARQKYGGIRETETGALAYLPFLTSQALENVPVQTSLESQP